MSSKKALGRGLQALIQATSSRSGEDSVQEIPIQEIVANPYQPRKTFSEESIRDLAISISSQGLLQPVVLRRSDQGFEIVYGERRFRAIKSLGWEKIPSIVREISDREMLVLGLLENMQREDLNPLEEAQSIQKLAEEFSMTHEELAQSLGKSRSHITNSLRILKLPADVLSLVQSEVLVPGSARAILALPQEDLQSRVAKEAVIRGLNVRQVEDLVKEVLREASSSPSTRPLRSQTPEALRKKTEESLARNFRLEPFRRGFRLQLDFESSEDLESFLDRLHRLS